MAFLNWGMIGGGEGSQIGPAHRIGSIFVIPRAVFIGPGGATNEITS